MNLNESTIRDMVENKLYTDQEIADYYQCAVQKIIRFKTVHKIHKPFHNKQWLINEYVNKKRTIKDIADSLRTNRENVRLYLRKFGITTDTERARQAGKKYHFNERIFQTIDTEEKAYWLGFITGDGCIEDMPRTRSDGSIYHNYRLRFTLAEKDVDHLKKFLKFIGDETIPIKHYSTTLKGRDKIYRLVSMKICCKQLALDLMAQGILPSKSMKEQPPNIDEKFYPAFVRGECDADGCVSDCIPKQHRRSVDIVGSYKLMNWIKEAFAEGDGGVKEEPSTPGLFRFCIYGEKAIHFLNKMYKNATIYLDRKYERYLNMIT